MFDRAAEMSVSPGLAVSIQQEIIILLVGRVSSSRVCVVNVVTTEIRREL
jgi:hypothetical protein